jgi:hypothetical protein
MILAKTMTRRIQDTDPNEIDMVEQYDGHAGNSVWLDLVKHV